MRAELRSRWPAVAQRAMLAAFALQLSSSAVSAQGRDSVEHSRAHGMGWGRETYVLTEVLEYDGGHAVRPVLFDVLAWTGGASRRVWLKADGAAATAEDETHAEFQLLYGWMVSPWWDLQVGARADVVSAAGERISRAGAVVGLQGLAPGWFELEPSLFVSASGNASIDVTASYDLYLTQRLVLQPRLESTVALTNDDDFAIGRGLSNTAFGLRTRFEFRREIAPYFGVVWERDYGRSAELAQLAGAPVSETRVVAGLRLWR